MCGSIAPSEVFAKRARRKRGQVSLLRDAEQLFGERRKCRHLKRKISQTWSQGRRSRPLVHKAEGVMLERVSPVFEVVAQKLRLPGSHVDVDRTFCFAGLAGEAKIERILYLLVLPAFGDDVALHHFP